MKTALAECQRGDVDHAGAVRSYDLAFVLTTGFRDFPTYGVAFATPEGAVYA